MMAEGVPPRPSTTLDCEHDWSVRREIPAEDLPTYAKGPVFDVFCARAGCGVKQTLKERLALEMAAAESS